MESERWLGSMHKPTTAKKEQMRLHLHPLEGFGGRVHDTCTQGCLADPSTKSQVDTSCWGERRNLRRFHSSFPQILKKRILIILKVK